MNEEQAYQEMDRTDHELEEAQNKLMDLARKFEAPISGRRVIGNAERTHEMAFDPGIRPGGLWNRPRLHGKPGRNR